MTQNRRRSKRSRQKIAAPNTYREIPAVSVWVDALQAAMRRGWVRVAAAAAVLGCFALLGVSAARTHTPTADEFVYVPEGYYHLRTGDFGFDVTNPPLLKMAVALPLLGMDLNLDTDPKWRDDRTGWGPWIFGTRFMELNHTRYLDAFFAARLVVLSIAVVLGLLVFWKATTLLSPLSAVAVLILYASMPPQVAHSALATLDVGVAALIFAAFIASERFAVRGTWPSALSSGALFGLALIA